MTFQLCRAKWEDFEMSYRDSTPIWRLSQKYIQFNSCATVKNKVLVRETRIQVTQLELQPISYFHFIQHFTLEHKHSSSFQCITLSLVSIYPVIL